MRTFLLTAALTLGAVTASFTAFPAQALDKVEFSDTGLPPPSGTLVVPDQFTRIQAAIDAASYGDTILLRAGETFVGHYRLRAKSGTGVIVIRGDAPASELPGPC